MYVTQYVTVLFLKRVVILWRINIVQYFENNTEYIAAHVGISHSDHYNAANEPSTTVCKRPSTMGKPKKSNTMAVTTIPAIILVIMFGGMTHVNLLKHRQTQLHVSMATLSSIKCVDVAGSW